MHNPFNTSEYHEYSKKPLISPLEFDYIPPEPKSDIEMADGGTIPFRLSSSEGDDEEERISALIRKELELEKERLKLNVQQPIGDEFEGSDAQNEGVDAGINTVAGTMAGITAGLIGLSESTSVVSVVGQMTGLKPATDLTGLWGKANIDYVPSEKSKEGKAKVAELEGRSSLDVSAAPSAGSGSTAGEEGEADTSWQHGGQIKGYQEGAMVEGQADTTMDASGLGPMGLVDDMAGDQVTGVEDDLNMEVEEGAYVLNADTVELVGLKDLNQLTKDAIDIAIESDIPLPKSVDPTQKVPIKISNGEFVVPAILVPIIGLENLEKMNKRGLEYREKNKEEAPPQEAQQQDVPVEPSEVPSRGVPGEINLAQGGALADQMNQLM